MSLGAGTTLTFQSGYCAQILSMNVAGVTRAPVPTTHFGTTGGQTFVPSDTYDPGELVIECQRDVSAAVPISAGIETVTITYPDLSTQAAQGFLVEHEEIAQREEKIRETLRIKRSGNLTFT